MITVYDMVQEVKKNNPSIVSRYNEIWRHYHNVNYIDNMAKTVDFLAEKSGKKEELTLEVLALSVFYHRAVYIPGSHLNEKYSAQLVEKLELDDLIKQEVIHIILGTQSYSTPQTLEEAIIFDADLAILGSEHKEYAEYTENIFKESQTMGYSDGIFLYRRKEFVKNALERDNLFTTKYALENWNDKAKTNLTVELEQLERLSKENLEKIIKELKKERTI